MRFRNLFSQFLHQILILTIFKNIMSFHQKKNITSLYFWFWNNLYIHTQTHTHIYIYIYIECCGRLGAWSFISPWRLLFFLFFWVSLSLKIKLEIMTTSYILFEIIDAKIKDVTWLRHCDKKNKTLKLLIIFNAKQYRGNNIHLFNNEK